MSAAAPRTVVCPDVSGVLLDIEGTVSPIAFVAGVLFPFARRELPRFLERRWHAPEVHRALERVARDMGLANFSALRDGRPDDEVVRKQVLRLLFGWMDEDAKLPGLKELQGLVWRAGYESGELRAPVYPDVPAALAEWQSAGIDRRVYSSGSVAAQELFFGHTDHGDLRPFFSGYHDTEVGPKRVASSYAAIAAHWHLPPAEVLFLSDVPAELSAASEAGLQTALVVRPGNAPLEGPSPHPVVEDFHALDLRPPQK